MKIILFIVQRLIIKQSLNNPYKYDTNMAQQQVRDNELLVIHKALTSLLRKTTAIISKFLLSELDNGKFLPEVML